MALLVKNSRDNGFRIRFVRPDGRQASLRLDTASMRHAEQVQWFIEDLVASCKARMPPSAAAAAWVGRASDKVRRQLEWVRLAETQRRRALPTLAEWLREYIARRSDVKPKSRLHYSCVAEDLLRFLGGKTRIDRVSASQAKGFPAWLKSVRRLADATVHMHCRRARQFFAAAVRERLVTENPFAGIRYGSVANPKRLYFVTREEAEAVLKACPTDEWRLIFALCRYGGLRCSSEVIGLRWKDVDWARMRFAVHAPKTEHCLRGLRNVPIFPELLPHLKAVLDQGEKNEDHVIKRYRNPSQNLTTYLHSIVLRAGLKPWPRLTQNLRSTRETELAEEFPLHVVCAWIGNSGRVAMKHYLQVTEAHFEKAAGVLPRSYAAATRQALPTELARDWAGLPEHIRKAILMLASTALRTRF